jgi:hypothetical protein
MSSEIDRLIQQTQEYTGQRFTAADLHRITTALQDDSIDAPLPHHTPSLIRINHYWSHQ